MQGDLLSWRDRVGRDGITCPEWRGGREVDPEGAHYPPDLGRVARELNLPRGELRELVALGPGAAALLCKCLRALSVLPADAASKSEADPA